MFSNKIEHREELGSSASQRAKASPLGIALRFTLLEAAETETHTPEAAPDITTGFLPLLGAVASSPVLTCGMRDARALTRPLPSLYTLRFPPRLCLRSCMSK